MRAGKVLGKGMPGIQTLNPHKIFLYYEISTYSAWEHGLVINAALYPCHEMLDILRSWHLGWLFENFRVLPQIFKPS